MQGPDRSEVLRFQLASVGIALDDAPANRAQVPAPAPTPGPADVDRAAIREILSAAGAPEKHLDWLTQSCPSIEIAHTYKPPEPEPERR
jgi:hypothetical protein